MGGGSARSGTRLAGAPDGAAHTRPRASWPARPTSSRRHVGSLTPLAHKLISTTGAQRHGGTRRYVPSPEGWDPRRPPSLPSSFLFFFSLACSNSSREPRGGERDTEEHLTRIVGEAETHPALFDLCPFAFQSDYPR